MNLYGWNISVLREVAKICFIFVLINYVSSSSWSVRGEIKTPNKDNKR